MDILPSYVNVILAEKSWSWTLVGMIYLLASLILRSFFFRSLVRQTKEVDPVLYSAVKSSYLRNSGGGWVIFFLSFLLVMIAWMGWRTVRNDLGLLLSVCLLLPSLFSLSLALHAKTYAKALLTVLRERTGIEKEL